MTPHRAMTLAVLTVCLLAAPPPARAQDGTTDSADPADALSGGCDSEQHVHDRAAKEVEQEFHRWHLTWDSVDGVVTRETIPGWRRGDRKVRAATFPAQNSEGKVGDIRRFTPAKFYERFRPFGTRYLWHESGEDDRVLGQILVWVPGGYGNVRCRGWAGSKPWKTWLGERRVLPVEYSFEFRPGRGRRAFVRSDTWAGECPHGGQSGVKHSLYMRTKFNGKVGHIEPRLSTLVTVRNIEGTGDAEMAVHYRQENSVVEVIRSGVEAEAGFSVKDGPSIGGGRSTERESRRERRSPIVTERIFPTWLRRSGDADSVASHRIENRLSLDLVATNAYTAWQLESVTEDDELIVTEIEGGRGDADRDGAADEQSGR